MNPLRIMNHNKKLNAESQSKITMRTTFPRLRILKSALELRIMSKLI